jgi:hypothetical protein
VVGVALLVAGGRDGSCGQVSDVAPAAWLGPVYRTILALLHVGPAQQFLLQDLVLLRLLRLLESRKAAVLAATGLFVIAHLPNPLLIAATLIWGLAACLPFLRYRNLYSPAMAHAIFGICTAIPVPGPVDNMRVGRGYSIYRHPGPQGPI